MAHFFWKRTGGAAKAIASAGFFPSGLNHLIAAVASRSSLLPQRQGYCRSHN